MSEGGPSPAPESWNIKNLRSFSKPRLPPPPNPTLVEVNEWVWPSHCHQHEAVLRHGQLLRWMDVAACLSAERHAQMPCVTVSVDNITFQSSVKVGYVVVLKAVVNRSFKSSLEVGLTVESEDPFSGTRQHICKAFFVFVARPSDGSKVQLPSLSPVTEEEKREYLLAAERRRMRTTYSKDIMRIVKTIHKEKKRTTSISDVLPTRSTCASATTVHTVQIVLPVHANHHGTTFGGQIMEWMTDVASLSGLRLSRSPLQLEGIESIYFRGPSHVGERVSLQSCVNRIFSGSRFEVGVRVEGYTVGGETRHINSAFFTFRLVDHSMALPQLLLQTKVEKERAANATARHYLWLDRMAIQFEERQVSLTSENAYELILKTVSQLLTNYSLSQWDNVVTQPFLIRKHQTDATLVVRVSSTIQGVSAAKAFNKLLNYSRRTDWDFMCKHIRLVRDINMDNRLIHLAMKSPTPDTRPKDFVLIACERNQIEYDGCQLYVVAYRSVQCDDIPDLDSYDRSHVISSGYILRDCTDLNPSSSSALCEVTYIHQVGSSVMPFMAEEFVGTSDLIQKLFSSLCSYLTKQ